MTTSPSDYYANVIISVYSFCSDGREHKPWLSFGAVCLADLNCEILYK